MVRLCSVEKDMVTIKLCVNISGSMLDAEEQVQAGLNVAGVMLTCETLKRFDTDGASILTGPLKWTTKGQV